MKTKLNLIVAAAIAAMLITSCNKDEDPPYVPAGPYANGAFISNEGTFGLENASVSYYDFAGDSIRNSIYTTVNAKPLGKVLQSTYLTQGYAYMILNMSDEVRVATIDNFKEAGVITGLSSPRCMTSYGDRGYISQWGENGVVKVVDLKTRYIVNTVDVGTGPEDIVVAGGNILVCNGGAYAVDSTITVINPAKDKVIDTVEVGYNPKEMVVDQNNDVWVICYGYVKYDSNFTIVAEYPSKLVKLSGQDYHKVSEFTISQTLHPQHIAISRDKSTVYYGGGFGFTGIFAMRIDAPALPAAPLIGEKSFYGFNVNPGNGDIYALDAGDFMTPGTLYRYSAAGALLKQYSVGIAPNGAAFN